jgi:hypothetical protein
MKRWLRGSVVLATAVGMWSCSGDPTDSFRGSTSAITATPTSLFLPEGETKAVIVQAVDDQGNPLASTFTTSVGSGITVVEDTTFLPSNGAPIQGQTRYLVTANTFVGSSFTVSADGKSLEIPVRSLPLTFSGAFSNVAPALGDTVTLTAPPGIKFGAGTSISFPGAQGEVFITGISADSTVLSFLPPPGADTLASVSGLELTYALGVFPNDTIETTTKVTTPAVSLSTNFSNVNPAVNEVVTVTATGFLFLPTVGVVQGADTAVVLGISADGSTMSFVPTPGADTIPTIFGVALSVLPEVSLTLPASATVTVPSTIPVAAGTAAFTTAPTINIPADSGFTSIFRDAPPFPGGVREIRYYKVVVPTDGDYTITMDWTVGTDIDMAVCPAAGVATDDCDFSAATGDHPESKTFSLTAGTYYVYGQDWGKNAVGTKLTITMTRDTP